MYCDRLECDAGAEKNARYYGNDDSNDSEQQVKACIAATVTALACKCVDQNEDQADYGNGVQKGAPEIAPRRERSVSLRQKFVRCFGVDSLFHVFSPFLRRMPKYYTYRIPLFSFFGKSFFQYFLFFHKNFFSVFKARNLQGVFHISNTVKPLPRQVSILEDEVGMCTVLFGNGNGTGIDIKIIFMLNTFWNVRVSVQENVALDKRWKLALVIDVSMGGINHALPYSKNGIVGKHGEIEHHLVYLGIAISAYAKQSFFDTVEHFDNLLGSIVARQIVAWPVIKHVTKQHQLLRSFARECLQKLTAVICRTVNIGCDHPFHFISLLNSLNCESVREFFRRGG